MSRVKPLGRLPVGGRAISGQLRADHDREIHVVEIQQMLPLEKRLAKQRRRATKAKVIHLVN